MAFKLAEAFVRITTQDQTGPGINSAKQKLQRDIASLAQLIGGGLSAATGVGILRSTLGLAAAAEQSEIAFNTILKDAERTRELLKELDEFSVSTPFEPTEVRKAAQALLAFRNEADEIPGILQLLGDAAAGTGSNLGELTRAFNKIKSVGKLTGETFEQLAERGVNLRVELAEMLGKTQEEIVEMQKKGEISFDLVVKALQRMTREGGIFFGAMEKQSRSFTGLMSTLQGVISAAGKAIGRELLGPAKLFVDTSINLFNQIMRLNTATDGMVAKLALATVVLGTAKAAAVALNMSLRTLITTMISAAASALPVAAPYIAAIAAVGGLIIGVRALIRWLSSTREVQEAWTASVERLKIAWDNIRSAAGTVLTGIRNSINGVISTINGVFGTSISNMKGGIVDFVASTIDGFSNMVLNASEWIRVLVENWDTAMSLIGAAATSQVLKIRDTFLSLPSIMAFVGVRLAMSIVDGFKMAATQGLVIVANLASGITRIFQRLGVAIIQAIRGLDVSKISAELTRIVVDVTKNISDQFQKGVASAAGAKELKDAITFGEDTKQAADEVKRLTEELLGAKKALEEGREEQRDGLTPEGEKKQNQSPTLDNVTIKKAKFDSGIFGIADLNKQLQQRELKALDQAKKTAAHTAVIADHAKRQTALMKEAANTPSIPVANE